MADLIPIGTKLKDGKASINTKIASIDTTTTSLQTQITTNDQSRITADTNHANSTTAHPAQNITYSGTVPSQTHVKGAIDATYSRIDNIIAGAPSSAAEVIDARTGSDSVARASLGVMVREIHSKQLAAVNSPVIIKHGLNSVNAPEGGKLDIKVKGKTLVNQMGKLGNVGETLWTVGGNVSNTVADTTQYVIGSKSQKGTLLAASGNRYITINMHKLEVGKYYYAFAYVRQSVVGDVDFMMRKLDGTWSTVVLDRKLAMVANTWIRFDLKFAGFDDYAFKPMVEFAGSDARDVWIDACGVIEVDSTTYNKMGVDAEYSGDKLADKFPYVDGMKPLTTPYSEKKGKNLLPPFTGWTLHANSTLIDPYKFTLNATANYQNNHIKIDVLPSTTYTFSGDLDGGVVWIHNYSKGVVGTQLSSGTTPFTFTTSSNTDQVNILLDNNTTVGAFTFSNPQLELGSTASAFTEFNSDYAYAVSDSTGRPLALCSNIDGTVADEINLSTGVKFKRHEYLDLDGSLVWSYNADGTSAKEVYVPIANSISFDSNAKMSKFDGKILKNDTSTDWTTAGKPSDTFNIWSTGNVFVHVADSDSGWTDAMTPDSSEIKAYFYGYAMCSSDGSAYVSGTKYWKKITDGTGITSTLPTESYTGYTPYKLQYQLATAVEEVVTVEGAINLHSGLNQVEMGEGVIVRELANPTQPVADPTYYRINNKWSAAVIGENYLKNRADRIAAIYKNGVPDKKWTILNGNADGGNANGNAFADIKNADYNSSAIYTVSYILLDKYGYTSNVVDVTASVPGTQKAVLEAVVQQQADTATVVSVVQTQYARKNQGQWIAPVLLNSWVNSAYTSGYFKDEFGLVRFRGTIINGTSTNGIVLFTLPQSFRPKNNVSFPIRIYTTGEGLGTLLVEPSGSVKILSGSTELSLDSVSFRAEQ